MIDSLSCILYGYKYISMVGRMLHALALNSKNIGPEKMCTRGRYSNMFFGGDGLPVCEQHNEQRTLLLTSHTG